MPEILAIQMAALLLALLSIGAADFVHHGGRISQAFHSLWVSSSIVAMCLPILVWLAGIFVGQGAIAWGVVGVLEAALFLGLYRNLNNLPAGRKLGHGLPPPAEQPQPPRAG
ncbi:MAG: hypothetical protein JO081_18470 [Alphaproteobacteria bacterium]|nr:hypothetical protein [Alphaproteobacteria bacterium]